MDAGREVAGGDPGMIEKGKLKSPLHDFRRLECPMARKSKPKSFEEILDALRAHSFDVAGFTGVAGGMLVSKHGAGAVLVAAKDGEWGPGAVFAEAPGLLVRGEVARLLDRGYQKFIKTSQFELPASADQLHSIHAFHEELSQVIGGESLYNESLGTTSDVHRYDRLRGREASQPAVARPWELTGGH
jgi:hypothetical protein